MTVEEVKVLVRQQHGYRCLDCGLPEDDQRARRNGAGLHVHRLTPGSDYTIGGCVPLCTDCHRERHKGANSSFGLALRRGRGSKFPRLPASVKVQTTIDRNKRMALHDAAMKAKIDLSIFIRTALEMLADGQSVDLAKVVAQIGHEREKLRDRLGPLPNNF